MDYVHIVLLGWMNEKALDYFKNQFDVAKERGIDSNTFHFECYKFILKLEEDIEFQYASKKAKIMEEFMEFRRGQASISKEYKPELTYEDKRDFIENEYNEKLNAIKRHNFVVDVSKYSSTKEKYWYLHMDLTYDEILLLKSNLDNAKKIVELKPSSGIQKQDTIILDVESHTTKIKINAKKTSNVEDDKKRIDEILKPLSGYWNRAKIMTDKDYNRLKNYIIFLTEKDELPKNLEEFPFTKVSNEFIRKTIYEIYRYLGKKHRAEFIYLIHLFRQFNNTQETTTNQKFSNYSGDFERDKKTMITYI